jgi:hypothetical protein
MKKIPVQLLVLIAALLLFTACSSGPPIAGSQLADSDIDDPELEKLTASGKQNIIFTDPVRDQECDDDTAVAPDALDIKKVQFIGAGPDTDVTVTFAGNVESFDEGRFFKLPFSIQAKTITEEWFEILFADKVSGKATKDGVSIDNMAIIENTVKFTVTDITPDEFEEIKVSTPHYDFNEFEGQCIDWANWKSE